MESETLVFAQNVFLVFGVRFFRDLLRMDYVLIVLRLLDKSNVVCVWWCSVTFLGF